MSRANYFTRPLGWTPLLKRVFDLFVIGSLSLLLAPVLAVCVLAIWALDGRPIFYLSKRRVYLGHTIWVVKFRTMRRDAERIANRDTVPVTSTRFLNLQIDSPLYTPVGRWIERLMLTELPQLYHVILGQMSLVGNRPLPENVIASLAELYPQVEKRFGIPAGLTGPVQLVGRDAISDADRLQLEIAYCHAVAESYSIWLDLRILFYTVLLGISPKYRFTPEQVLRLISRPAAGQVVKRRSGAGHWWLHSVGVGLQLLASLPALAGSELVLGPGDKIAISVHKRPDLSGEFRVLPTGYLSLPLMGELPAAGRNLTEVKQAIVDRFRETALLPDPRVNIDLVETRAIFVGGDVRRPGSFPYQIGMTVRNAIAAAGGLRGVELETIAIHFEVGRLREKLRQSQGTMDLATIRRARLLAERDDRQDFELPITAQSGLGETKAKQAYESERALLRQRTESHRSQVDLTVRQIGLFKGEITALEGQTASKEKEGELVAEERKRIELLMQRGLTPNSGRSIELQRILVQIEGEQRALATNIVKARQEIARVDQVMANLANQRQLEITTLLKEADDTISNLMVAIEESRISLAEAQEVLPGGSASPAGGSRSEFIVRRGGNENLTIAARLDTPLLPGDAVDVPGR